MILVPHEMQKFMRDYMLFVPWSILPSILRCSAFASSFATMMRWDSWSLAEQKSMCEGRHNRPYSWLAITIMLKQSQSFARMVLTLAWRTPTALDLSIVQSWEPAARGGMHWVNFSHSRPVNQTSQISQWLQAQSMGLLDRPFWDAGMYLRIFFCRSFLCWIAFTWAATRRIGRGATHWNGMSPETRKSEMIRRTETCVELELRIHNFIERGGVPQNTKNI